MAELWRDLDVPDSSESDEEGLSGFSGSESDACLEFDVDEGVADEDICEQRGIQPYMYKPRLPRARPTAAPSPASPSNAAEASKINETVESQWCTCHHCQPQETADENICCQAIPAVAEKLDEAVSEPIQCITDHPGFIAVCTNVWSLETAWYQYKQQYDDAYEGPRHRKLRHVAYRQFVMWIWHYLGRHVRVVLPSCAVSCIRAHFPPPGDEDDHVFEGFKLPNIGN